MTRAWLERISSSLEIKKHGAARAFVSATLQITLARTTTQSDRITPRAIARFVRISGLAKIALNYEITRMG